MGFANYHKVTDCEECFSQLDLFVNQEIMKFLQAKYPQTSFTKLQQKYWMKQADGRYVFCLVRDKKVRILNLADVICACHQKVDVRKNIFLDTTYFEKLSKQRKVQNVVGNYARIWRKEEGRCFLCNGILEKEIDKEVLTVLFQGRGLVYVHRSCMGGKIQFKKEHGFVHEIAEERKKRMGKFEN